MTSTLNKDSATPLYSQLKKLLEVQIIDGTLLPHVRVPSERELSDQYGISRMTARQALVELIQEGRLYTSVGKGTFVAEPKISQSLQVLTGFTEDMRARGLHPTTRLLQRGYIEAVGSVATGLRVVEGTKIACISRLRLADDEPMALETSCLLFPGVDQLLAVELDGSLYAILQQQFGLFPKEAIQEMEAMLAGPYERDLLHLLEGAPVLKLQRTTFDHHGHPFEHVQSIYRGDRYRFVARLTREGAV